ncbi:MAG: response regulator [Desulfobacteraceae bacterium]|nr:MAG: response regulator [Desulfobacteraceae bacterium]
MDKENDILIIDDDRDLVHSIRIVLESKHYAVRTAHNGKEGYRQIETKTPDLIILDVMMATDTEGFDLAFKLKNREPYRDIPILMLTSFPRKMAEEGPEKFQHIMGEDWPVTQFMEKPVDPDVLLKTVAELIRGE